MRNLKKMLSLVMALAMIASFMVVGASAADFTDAKDITNTEAVNMLAALGVIKGRDTGAFDPTGTVTRAEMAKMICVVMNGGKDPNLTGVGSFPDTKTHWAAGYIEYCKNMRIVAGSNDGNFYPDKTVTGTEAAKMILMSLGYDAVSEKFSNDANWETNINVTAGTKGLYSDLAVVASQGLSRDNAAQMIYNGLEANMVSYKMIGIINGNGVSQSYDLEKTLLAEKFGVVTVEGIVVANEYGSVASSAGDAHKDTGKTQIAVTSDNGVSGTYSISTTPDMLGQSVTLYIKYKNAGTDKDATVFGTTVLSSDNQTFTAVDGDLDGLMDDNDLSLASGVKYFKNFAQVDGFVTDSTKVTAKLPLLKNGGEIKVIDNDNDDEVDYVLYTEYTASAVTAKSTTGKGYLTLNGTIGKVEDSSKIVGFDDVNKGDFVMAVQYGGKTYVEKAETVTGSLSAYSTSKNTVKIDGTEYKMSGITATVANTDPEVTDVIATYVSNSVLDVSATFYLDNNGCVVAVGQAADSNVQYAVLLGFQNKKDASNGTLGQDAKAKVLLSDGTIATYVVNSIGGKAVTGVTGASDLPQNAEVGFKVADQGNTFPYTINKDGQIKIGTGGTKESVGNTVATSAEFTKNRSTLVVKKDSTAANDKTYTITGDTIFLYYDNSKVTRYVGKNNAPDLSLKNLTGADVTISVATKGNSTTVASVVYVNTQSSGDFDGNYMYIYSNKVVSVADGYEVSAIINGEKTNVVVEGGLGTVTGDKIANTGLYSFSKDSKDLYTVKQSQSSDDYVVLGGTVSTTGRDYVNFGAGKEYSITKESNIVALDKDNNLTTGASIAEKDTVTVVYNKDNEVVYAVITKVFADGGSGGSGSTTGQIDKIELAGSGSALTVTVTLKDNTTTAATITAKLERSSDGEKWVALGNMTSTGIAANAKTGTATGTGTVGNLYRAVVTVTIDGVDIATNYVTNIVEGTTTP